MLSVEAHEVQPRFGVYVGRTWTSAKKNQPPLVASLILLALVIGPTGTYNGPFGDAS